MGALVGDGSIAEAIWEPVSIYLTECLLTDFAAVLVFSAYKMTDHKADKEVPQSVMTSLRDRRSGWPLTTELEEADRSDVGS